MAEPSEIRREELMRQFNKAMFARDMPALYAVVTADFVWRVAIGPTAPGGRELRGAEQIAAYLDERARTYERLRFNDVVTYHASDCSFVSFRLSGSNSDGIICSCSGTASPSSGRRGRITRARPSAKVWKTARWSGPPPAPIRERMRRMAGVLSAA